MTEGPEARYLANYVSKRFLKKRLRNMKILGGRYKTHGPPHGFKDFLKQLHRSIPVHLVEVWSVGKVIFLMFDSGYVLVAKMGMVGWFYTAEDMPLHKNEAHVVFEFEGGKDLIFADFRNFGTLQFTNNAHDLWDEMAYIAPDIIDGKMDDILKRVPTIKPTSRIEDVLMDQTALVSGIGNIIKSEALYEAKVSPKKHFGSLKPAELRAVLEAARKYARRVLRILESAAIHSDKYVALQKVYQREEDPQGHRVHSYKSAHGRTTFWVPEIQH